MQSNVGKVKISVHCILLYSCFWYSCDNKYLHNCSIC